MDKMMRVSEEFLEWVQKQRKWPDKSMEDILKRLLRWTEK